MGILERFKKKKAPEKPQGLEVVAKPARPLPKKGERGRAHEILMRPVFSEKGTSLAHTGKYVFAVAQAANKNEIKKSIERLYDVHVENVRVVILPGKNRRYGRTRGKTSDWKKAIITVKKGERIPGIIEAVG